MIRILLCCLLLPTLACTSSSSADNDAGQSDTGSGADVGQNQGDVGTSDMGQTDDTGSEADPICHVVVTGAQSETFDCSPSSSAEYANLTRVKVGEPKSSFGLVVPATAPNNGLQLNILLETTDVPTADMMLTEAGGTTHVISVIQYVDGAVARQWSVFKSFPGEEDQGTFNLDVTALRSDMDTNEIAMWSPTGTLSLTAPVYPLYGGTDSVDVQVSFRPRN
ncbi:MAG: hypothetical protein R3E66_05450 [bacterium]